MKGLLKQGKVQMFQAHYDFALFRINTPVGDFAKSYMLCSSTKVVKKVVKCTYSDISNNRIVLNNRTG